jgi:hypothetical protein
MKLFDVIISQGQDRPKLVFTCNSAPSLEILSTRVIPIGQSHLNQDVYDGPNLGLLSKTLQVRVLSSRNYCFKCIVPMVAVLPSYATLFFVEGFGEVFAR